MKHELSIPDPRHQCCWISQYVFALNVKIFYSILIVVDLRLHVPYQLVSHDKSLGSMNIYELQGSLYSHKNHNTMQEQYLEKQKSYKRQLRNGHRMHSELPFD